MGDLSLTICGEVESPLSLSQSDLNAFPADDRVEDIRALGSKREGAAVRLSSILARARPTEGAKFVTFQSPSDDFNACVPLARVIAIGYVAYAIGGEPMTSAQGGPFRFMIPDPAACQSDELDECVNVKHLERIVLSSEPGRDTRPEDEEEHAKIHAHEG